jgi:L-fuconolactonase
MIVDAHHHFWDPTRAVYPWMGPDLAPIARPFGPAELAPLLTSSGIERTILVQTRASIDETRESLATAAATEFVAGVIGWVDLADAGVGEMIAALRAGRGGDRLVGIRHQVHDEVDPGWLLREDVRNGLQAVGRAGLTFDLLVRPRELPAALDTVRALPGLSFVIDHLAKPPIASGELEPWASLLAPFGALTNVSCKMSGMVTEADPERWTVTDLQAFAAHALEVFGPERVMFGSDWPVCLLAAAYHRVVDAARQLTAGLSEPERSEVFGGTATAIYGLPGD